MMKNKHLFSGISVVLLAFFLVLTACENGTTEVDGTVGISGQEAPAVTAKAVKGGVLLEWNPILDGSYSVWRKAGDAAAIQLPYNGDIVYQDKETGKYYYLDLVSDTNTLTKNTEYTYTVVASGAYKTIGKTEVKATPTDIPAKGTQFDPVSGVTLTLDSDTETISVSWTAGAVPLRYGVSVKVGDQAVDSTSTSLGETKASLDWDSSSQTEGEYVASVYAYAGSYYKSSKYVVSAKQKYVALFGSGSPSTGSVQPISANGTLTGFSVFITFGGAKPGVRYSVERAPVDAAGNAGDYAAVSSLYANVSATTALTAADLTADDVGTLRNGAYDKSLPTTLAKYKYRVKAEKTGVTTQTKEISSTVTVNPYDYASGSLSIAAATTDTDTGAKTYAVTPSLTYKGILQTGDKLVIYYVKGSGNVAESGPYTKGPEFSKAELEAATVVAKNLVIPKAAGDSVACVKAYIVLADGTQRNVTSYISSSGGVSSTGSIYVTLNY